mgnify:CR=1 FL=1
MDIPFFGLRLHSHDGAPRRHQRLGIFWRDEGDIGGGAGFELGLEGEWQAQVCNSVSVGAELITTHVHLELRVQVRGLRFGLLMNGDGDAEAPVQTVGELVARHLRHARAPNAEWSLHFPDRADAHGLTRQRDGCDRRTNVSNRDGDARMNPLLALRPRHVGVHDDALPVEIESAPHAAQRIHALLGLVHLPCAHALGKNRLGLANSKNVASAFRKHHRRTRMKEKLQPRKRPERIVGVLRLLGCPLQVTHREDALERGVGRNRVLQKRPLALTWVDELDGDLWGRRCRLLLLAPGRGQRRKHTGRDGDVFHIRKHPRHRLTF